MGGSHSTPSSGGATFVDVLHSVPGITQRLDDGDLKRLMGTSRNVCNAVLRHRRTTLRATMDSLRALEHSDELLGDHLATLDFVGLHVPSGDAGKLLAACEGCSVTTTSNGDSTAHVRAVRRILEWSLRNATEDPVRVVALHLPARLPGVHSYCGDAEHLELVGLRRVLRQLQQATGRHSTQVAFEADGCTATTRATAEAFEVVRLTSRCDRRSLMSLRLHHGTLEELDVTGEFRLEGDYRLPVPAEVVFAWDDLWRWIGRARDLRVLRLTKPSMTPDLANDPSLQQAMVDALLACEQLEVLQLRQNVLLEAVITQIMPRLVTLRELRLRSCVFSDEVAEVLAAGLADARGGALRTLDLNQALAPGGEEGGYQNAFNLTAALPSLARLLRCGRLEDLHMSCVGLTDGGASSLAEAIEDESCNLRVLDVSFNKLREGVAALGAAIGASRTLEVVNMDGNFIGDEGLSAVGVGLQLSKTIRELTLRPRLSSTFEPWTEGARSLGEGLRRTRSLRVLRIDGFSFQPADYAAILDGLAVNSSVEVLSMFNWAGNTVDDCVARKVADMLRRNRTLRRLHMNWKNVTWRGFAAVGSVLRSGNDTLQYLSVNRGKDGRCPLWLRAVRASEVMAFLPWGAAGIGASICVWACGRKLEVKSVLQQGRNVAPSLETLGIHSANVFFWKLFGICKGQGSPCGDLQSLSKQVHAHD